MKKSLYDTLDELVKSIKSFAEDSYETGHPIDSFKEFKRILHEDEDMNKLCSQLYNIYFEHFESCKED